ncbi:MAG: nitrogenase component 1 [Candidatus Bathyarchaeia archaeon]
MRAIAFYGKGGIGKSTTLSNVIAALSVKGKKVLQIGCDPKHDSTRLLLGGFTQITVLEQLNTTGAVSLEQVMLTGYNGVKCIESGGPEPGVGCAGRGIIQTLQLLQDQGLDTSQFDYVFFDVLGDVVCGGFAVPMREGYADEVYIVTSGEIASLYAANNISKGLLRFSSRHGKLGGIIGNQRGIKNEREIIEGFAKRIGSEMVAFIPRSELVANAEFASKTILEFASDTELADVYRSIADQIESQKTPVTPKPLSDAELDEFFRQYCYGSKTAVSSTVRQAPVSSPPKQTLDVPANPELVPACQPDIAKLACTVKVNREPVQGCSLSGAFNVVSQLKDAVAIMYSPQGCSYISFCTHLNHSSFLYSDSRYLTNLLCTDMRETDVIFGGTKNLKETLNRLQKRFPAKTLFVITSCPAGIIGDDVDSVISSLSSDNYQILHVTSDGVLGGDYCAGVVNAYRLIAKEFIDPTVFPQGDSVNLIGEQTLATTADQNFYAINQILEALDVKINCRFVRHTNLKEIKNFKKAKINIPFNHDPAVLDLTQFLNTAYGTETLNAPLPIAFEETSEFVRLVAKRFGKETLGEKVIKEAKEVYLNETVDLKKFFAGKKALIFNSYDSNIDWLISTLLDLDVEILKICESNLFYPKQRDSLKYINLKFETNYPIEKYGEAVSETRPDFVLTAGAIDMFSNVPCDTFPVTPTYGFYSGLEYAKKLQLKLKIPFREGWRQDEHLF